jgi:hypothetical protein
MQKAMKYKYFVTLAFVSAIRVLLHENKLYIKTMFTKNFSPNISGLAQFAPALKYCL